MDENRYRQRKRSLSLFLSHKVKESTEGMRIIDFAENHFDQYLEFGTH